MGLLPEMSHPVHDGIRLAKHDADASRAGEGFLWFADRLLKGSNGDSPNPRAALGFLRQAAELGAPKAFLRIGEMCEAGIGTEPNLRLALAAYSRARSATTSKAPGPSCASCGTSFAAARAR